MKPIFIALFFCISFSVNVLAGSGSGADLGGTHGRITNNPDLGGGTGLRDHVDRFYEFQRGDLSLDEFRSNSTEIDLQQMVDEVNEDLRNPPQKQDVNLFDGQAQGDVDINVQELRSDGVREVTLDDGRVFSIGELEDRIRMKVRQQIRRK